MRKKKRSGKSQKKGKKPKPHPPWPQPRSATTMVRFPSAAVWAAEAVSVPLSKPLW
jgi:hypothetical protein